MTLKFITPCALCFAMMPSAIADHVDGIRSAMTRPIAPRGGVMMLPLVAQRSGDNWPSVINLRLETGQTLPGMVAWIHAQEQPINRHWTLDPRGLAVRTIDPTDTTAIDSDQFSGPVALFVVPRDGSGQLTLGKQQLKPIWVELPSFQAARELPRTTGPDRPDPSSPFEYWRWTLLAKRLGMTPPEPTGDEASQLVSMHYADLWRIALARLDSMSSRLAKECLDRLTHISIDRRQPFASWVSDPIQEGALLAKLLDFNLDKSSLLTESVTWLDQQESVFFWPDRETTDHIQFLFGITQPKSLVARFWWVGTSDTPTATSLEPGVLTTVNIDRVSNMNMLRIEVAGDTFDVPVGSEQIIAKPPGIFFRPLLAPLSLYDVQAKRQPEVPRDRQTHVQLRRLSGRWEVFFDCRREQPVVSQNTLPDIFTSFEDTCGTESVTLLLDVEGGENSTGVWLTVPEHGWPRMVKGSHDGTMQIHKKSFDDRWHCRIVLPDSWCPTTELIQLAFIRSHGGTHQLETGPNACVPWRIVPSRISIDLGHWDDLPNNE